MTVRVATHASTVSGRLLLKVLAFSYWPQVGEGEADQGTPFSFFVY